MQLVTLKITDRYQTSIFDVRYQTQIRYALNFYLRDYLGIFPNDKGKFPNNPVKKVEIGPRYQPILYIHRFHLIFIWVETVASVGDVGPNLQTLSTEHFIEFSKTVSFHPI